MQSAICEPQDGVVVKHGDTVSDHNFTSVLLKLKFLRQNVLLLLKWFNSLITLKTSILMRGI